MTHLIVPIVLQMQPVDLASVSDVKQRYEAECSSLIASSPIIEMKFPMPKLNRPITITLPVPVNVQKKKRPNTAAPTEKEAKKSTRPVSAAFGLGAYNQEGMRAGNNANPCDIPSMLGL